jgi:nucleoside-diphosphate-sugar epimerase
MTSKTAIVVGAAGVTGRNLVRHLDTLPDWRTIGLSRRAPDFPTKARFISVDLLDRADADAKLAGLTDATHLFYCGFQARPTWAEHNAPNLAMLVNAVEPIAAVAPGLKRVVLMEGTKIYGSHMGPFRTPAKETDPPHMLPNFYWDQEQWLRRATRRADFDFTALRPQTVCGFATGVPMNLINVIAVYAAISKELGLPLRFPGKPGAYNAIYQVTDAGLLSRAQVFAATASTASNEVFNITNTDFFRWCNVWPKIAEVFDMPHAAPQTIRLTELMADKSPLWDDMTARYGLVPHRYADLVTWPFGDYVFACDWDIMSDTLKIRQAGFTEGVDSEKMLVSLLADYRAQKIVP